MFLVSMKARLFILIFFTHTALYCQKLELVQPVRFLALGDSYTTGMAVDADQSWPNQLFARLAKAGYMTDMLQIIAQAGWTTEDLTEAIRQESPDLNFDFNLVSLLIGVNNQYQGMSVDLYEKEFEELLVTALSLAQGRKEGVFVISIPDYAYTPFGGGHSYISEGIDLYNNANRKITEKYEVTYFDLTFISRMGLDNPELVAVDKLHPSALMYKLWVDKIMDHLNSNNTTQAIADKILVSDGIKLFPNPASGNISFIITSGNNSAKNVLSIYALSGKLLFRKNDLPLQLFDKYTVGLPEMNEGFYLFELITETERYVSKMIIR
jgi:lysophospholipase L1-like esterase